jgi:hypothetical protein
MAFHPFMSLLRLKRRLVATMMLMIMVTLCLSMECHAVGPKSNGLHGTTAIVLPPSGDSDTPCCPADDHNHGDLDHCTSCLHCACNAPLMGSDALISYTPSLSLLNPKDRFSQLPEVYLPIFIPPQNLA